MMLARSVSLLVGTAVLTVAGGVWMTGRAHLQAVARPELPFGQSVSGFSARLKVRYRWYGAQPPDDEALVAQLPPDAQQYVRSHPMPVLINQYLRLYFVSRNRQVRLTVDDQLTVWDQRLSPTPNLWRAARLPASLVVELKVDHRFGSLPPQVMAGLPARRSRFSKYSAGVSAIALA
jgi:hypothetical protein